MDTMPVGSTNLLLKHKTVKGSRSYQTKASVGGGWPVLLSSCSCSGRRRAPAREVEGIFARTWTELEAARGRRRLVVAAEEGRWSRGRCGADGDDLAG